MFAKKSILVVVLTMFSLNPAIADPPAAHPKTAEPLVIDVFRGTPDIDGDLSDWNLSLMTPAVLDAQEQLSDDSSDKAGWTGLADCSAKFYLLWDDDNVYIAAIVMDDKLSQNKTGGSIWNADAVEVFFSTLNAVSGHDEHYQYGFNANAQKWLWDDMEGGGNEEPAYLTVATSITAEGYICEVSIPHGEITPFDWSAGSTIGFHPVVDDTDSTDRELQMTWTGRIAHDQSQGFGYMILSDTAAGGSNPLARRPDPKDGAILEQTWGTLAWRPGQWAVSHDLYVGDNFDDVNDGAADTFQGNYTETDLLVGFFGYPVPNGLVPGTTYYWRVDEVNDANAASPWKGNVWSFSIQPYTAYNPNPPDGAELVATDAQLTWSKGFGAKLHYFFIAQSFEDVNNATAGKPTPAPSYSPGLEREKVYYWRVDEFEGPGMHKGPIWAFTTAGAAGNSEPANGSTTAALNSSLIWTPAETAISHDLYFGTDGEAVRNATTSSTEYMGNKAKGVETHSPGKLAWDTDYFWRVDAIYPGSSTKGLVWAFKTADFLGIDDFESYNDIDPPDSASNTIFTHWADGYGISTNGALTAEELPPYAEQTIVHGGNQSMKYQYDTNFMISESTLTLDYPRDWTEEGVAELSLWFVGKSSNTGERIFIALNGTAPVYHDEPAASQINQWTRWVIPLQAFADQGVDLTNVNTVTIGFGTKNTPGAGGPGTVYFDDIQLNRPVP